MTSGGGSGADAAAGEPRPQSPGEAAAPASYATLGGAEFFEDFTREFYAGVASDPVLSAMYPEQDMAGAQRRLRLFLEQYWGGPTTYSDERGHPRLRMRHAPFAIDPDARDRWLACAATAWEAACATHAVPEAAAREFWNYLHSAAFAMVNTLPRI